MNTYTRFFMFFFYKNQIEYVNANEKYKFCTIFLVEFFLQQKYIFYNQLKLILFL